MDLQTSWNSVSFKPVSSVFADDATVIAGSKDGGGGIKTPVGCGDTSEGRGRGLMALLVLALSSTHWGYTILFELN